MTKLIDLTVNDFLATTASDAPAPGGGSIAALSALQAASLLQMVARLTLGRKRYADVQDEMQKLVETLGSAITLLTPLIDEDAESYNGVMAAYKLPKETDEQKAARAQAIEDALFDAATTPLLVARLAADLLPFAGTLIDKGNSNAVTDAGVATLCINTAVLGAVFNVEVNLVSVADCPRKAEIMQSCAEYKAAVAEHVPALLAKVNAALNS